MALVRFPNVMKYYLGNQSEFQVDASSIRELIEKIIEQYPTVKFHLVGTDGNLRRHFNIFVNGTHIRELDGMATQINPEDRVILMASGAGGSLSLQVAPLPNQVGGGNLANIYIDKTGKISKIPFILLSRL